MSSLLAFQNHKYPSDGPTTIPVAVTLDGDSYLERTSAFTGEADDALMAMYFKSAATANGTAKVLFHTGASDIRVRILPGEYDIQIKDSAGTIIVQRQTTNDAPDPEDDVVRELFISFDASTSDLQVYVDGVEDTRTPQTLIAGDGVVGLATGNAAICGQNNGQAKMLGEFYRGAVWFGIAPDLSSSSVRAAMADPDGTVGGTVLFDAYTTDAGDPEGTLDNQAGTGLFDSRVGTLA